ncbi:olfactory receptor 13H1-like [Cynocephalus volans]|uniref:olfactory receptor 13H1-like n=1 Tax=Cynocephalus volans TaxID=110931 RepID=UPI002FCAC59C
MGNGVTVQGYQITQIQAAFLAKLRPLQSLAILCFRRCPLRLSLLWIDEMNYQEIGNHTKVTEFVLVGMSKDPTYQSVLFWALMFLYILTLAGNSMIVFLVGVSSQLHTPMYFFLGNLSLLGLLFSTSAVPLIMANSLQNYPTISYSSCFAQLAIRAFLALAECFLLAIMAYDRNVAISNPLRYNLVISSRECTLMALAVWVTDFLLTVVPILLFPISFCGHNAVNHFSCEVQAIFKLLCSNTISLEVMMMVCAVISMPVPLTFILISYLCILRAVLRIHPTEAMLKAFSTCGSHLVVVTIYFGTLIYIYMRPQAKKSQDEDKIVSIFYAAVTPMLNPLIYTLRNKDVKAALRRVTCGAKSSCFKHTTAHWLCPGWLGGEYPLIARTSAAQGFRTFDLQAFSGRPHVVELKAACVWVVTDRGGDGCGENKH